MSNCPDCQQKANAGLAHVPDFSVAGFGAHGPSNVNLEGVHALMLSACVSASYNSATNQICFNVPIYGNYCVTSPVQLPVSAQLKACVQTCGSFIPTGLKVSIYANGTVIYSGVLWGSC